MIRRILSGLLLSALLLPAAASAGPAREAVEKILPRYRIYLPLEQALAKVEVLAGVEMTVDWIALENSGVKRAARVQLSGKNEKLSAILDLLLAQVARRGKPLSWGLTKGERGIVVTTQARLLGAGTATQSTPSPTRPRRTRRALGRNIDFEQTPLEEVLETIRQQVGMNLYVQWPALEKVGVERKTPVTVHVRNVTTARLLDLVLAGLNGEKGRYDSVYWVLEKGVVMVTTGSALSEIMRTRVYDISTLMHIVPQFRGPRVNVESISTPESNSTRTSGGGGGGDDPFGKLFEDDEDRNQQGKQLSIAEQREQNRDTIITIIKRSIGEEMWHPNGRGTIVIFKDKLVVTQSLLGFKLMEEAARR